METLTIDVSSPDAMKLIENLEALNLIKVVSRHKSTGQKLSEKYAGKLSTEVAEALQEYVTKSREEWSRDI